MEPARCQTCRKPVYPSGGPDLAPAAAGPSEGTRKLYPAPPGGRWIPDAWTSELPPRGRPGCKGKQMQTMRNEWNETIKIIIIIIICNGFRLMGSTLLHEHNNPNRRREENVFLCWETSTIVLFTFRPLKPTLLITAPPPLPPSSSVPCYSGPSPVVVDVSCCHCVAKVGPHLEHIRTMAVSL